MVANFYNNFKCPYKQVWKLIEFTTCFVVKKFSKIVWIFKKSLEKIVLNTKRISDLVIFFRPKLIFKTFFKEKTSKENYQKKFFLLAFKNNIWLRKPFSDFIYIEWGLFSSAYTVRKGVLSFDVIWCTLMSSRGEKVATRCFDFGCCATVFLYVIKSNYTTNELVKFLL